MSDTKYIAIINLQINDAILIKKVYESLSTGGDAYHSSVAEREYQVDTIYDSSVRNSAKVYRK